MRTRGGARDARRAACSSEEAGLREGEREQHGARRRESRGGDPARSAQRHGERQVYRRGDTRGVAHGMKAPLGSSTESVGGLLTSSFHEVTWPGMSVERVRDHALEKAERMS